MTSESARRCGGRRGGPTIWDMTHRPRVTRRPPRSRESAWTLTEIMVVVLIVGILLAIAAPNFANARERSRQKACVANLKLIDTAKEQYALDNRTRDGVVVPLTLLIGRYIKGPVFHTSTTASRALEFRCPSSGNFYGPTMGAIGQPPQCPTASARTGPYAHAYP